MGVPVRRINEATEVQENDGFLFYSLRPWSSFPWLARTIIRLLYKHYRWNTDTGSLETQGFYDTFETVEEAREFAREMGWGVQQLPKNRPLPSETCQYGYNDIPRSNARWVTTNRNLPFAAVETKQIQKQLERLSDSVRDYRATVK